MTATEEIFYTLRYMLWQGRPLFGGPLKLGIPEYEAWRDDASMLMMIHDGYVVRVGNEGYIPTEKGRGFVLSYTQVASPAPLAPKGADL